MRGRDSVVLIVTTLVTVGTFVVTVSGQDKQPPKIDVPKAGVPEIMTIEGEFVRVAYNNEGYVSLGYRAANQSIGEEWMLLEIGATVRDGKPNFDLTRSAISLETPDGKTLPLPTNSDYRQVDLRALERRSTVVRDSINYFPPSATQGCRIGFFAEQSSGAMAYDQVELSSMRGCVGRLYFKIPGGIQYGQHWLNVRFKDSVVRVPFRILTEDERKTLSKHYGNIKKQVDDAFKKKKD